MNSYALGLDLGIASIGWAIGPVSSEGDLTGIEAMGTFCYPSPVSEVKKGRRTTNRSNRGAVRRARHRLYHFKARRKALTRELTRLGWWPEDQDLQLAIRTQKLREVDGKFELAHPIALKVKGLSQPLEPYELGCILLHYQRHRGYLSTADLPVLLMHKRPVSKVVEPESEVIAEELLTDAQKEIRGLNNWIRSTRSRLQGRTISEFQLDILERNETPANRNPAIRARLSPPNKLISKIADSDKKKEWEKRQAPATDLRYDRWMYVEEFDKIWKVQTTFHSEMTEDLRNTIEKLVFHQDPLENKDEEVGFCELIPTYRRCRIGELVFQRHRILSYLANTDFNGRKLIPKERMLALELLMGRDKATFAEVKAALGLDPGLRFHDEPLPAAGGKIKGKGRGPKGAPSTIKGSDWGRKICQALGISGASLAEGGWYDELVHDLIALPEVARYRRLTEHYGLSDELALVLMSLEPPKGYAKRCSRVLRRIEPHLYAKDNLYEATHAAGYATVDTKPTVVAERIAIPADWTTGNPSVDASVRWSTKVINEIIDRHGKPTQIKIELPRQMAMGNEARAEEWVRINDRAKINDGYRKRLEEEGFSPTRKNLMRMQLADESGWASPYEPERKIPSLRDLLEDYDLDHIVPQSYAAEDGLSNLVLCPTHLNQKKGNRTPHEAFSTDAERWEAITQFIRSCSTMPRRKRDRILADKRPEQDMESRMLTQMGYIGKRITSLIATLGVDCVFVNGAITAEARRRYGLDSLLPKEEPKHKLNLGDMFGSEKNRLDLRHHAIDAASILMIDRSMAIRLTRYFQSLEGWRKLRKKGEKPEVLLEEPFRGVRSRLHALLPHTPVVRPPSRRNTGALHKQTMLPLEAFAGIRGPVGKFEVRGAHLLRFGLDGTVSGAWLKSSVHHGIIYESLSGARSLKSVSLFEVASTLSENSQRRKRGIRLLPIVDRNPPNILSRFVMAISNGDLVEYVGEKGAGAGFYRVGTIAVGQGFEISLFDVKDALSNPKSESSIRIRNANDLRHLRRRIILDVFGEVKWSEPPTFD